MRGEGSHAQALLCDGIAVCWRMPIAAWPVQALPAAGRGALTHPVSTTGRTTFMPASSSSRRASTSLELNSSGHTALAACGHTCGNSRRHHRQSSCAAEPRARVRAQHAGRLSWLQPACIMPAHARSAATRLCCPHAGASPSGRTDCSRPQSRRSRHQSRAAGDRHFAAWARRRRRRQQQRRRRRTMHTRHKAALTAMTRLPVAPAGRAQHSGAAGSGHLGPRGSEGAWGAMHSLLRGTHPLATLRSSIAQAH